MELRPLIVAGMLLISACGSSDDGAPVELESGQYEISAAGSVLGIGSQKLGKDSVCITANSADIPGKVLQSVFLLEEGCSAPKVERTGNALAASATCPLDLDIKRPATGTFSGKVIDGGLEGTLKFAADIPATAGRDAQAAGRLMGAASIEVTAIRKGPCEHEQVYEPAEKSNGTFERDDVADDSGSE